MTILLRTHSIYKSCCMDYDLNYGIDLNYKFELAKYGLKTSMLKASEDSTTLYPFFRRRSTAKSFHLLTFQSIADAKYSKESFRNVYSLAFRQILRKQH